MRWLQWALDNLWTLLIIAGVAAQLLQAVRARKNKDADAPEADFVPEDESFEDPELAERTRRIREEIQRKISERQRGGSPAPESRDEPEPPFAPDEPPLVREVAVERAPVPPVAAGHMTRLEAQRSAEILEQQAALAQRLRQAKEMKAASVRRAAHEAKTANKDVQARKVARGELLEDLHSPQALRRAFVLREVLGPPVGLR
jgi:hypothetical protein